MFEAPAQLALGLASGIIFGILLQKGQAAKFQTILGQLLLKDWTVVKIMAAAVAVGTIGVHVLAARGQADLHVQTAAWARLILGGVLFGAGLAVFGLCPGTSVAACGEGRRDAMAGVAGMFFGAGAYVAAFSILRPALQALPDHGKATLPQVTGTPAWPWAIGLAGVIAVGLAALERARPQPRNDA